VLTRAAPRVLEKIQQGVEVVIIKAHLPIHPVTEVTAEIIAPSAASGRHALLLDLNDLQTCYQFKVANVGRTNSVSKFKGANAD
jgi:hypothetical protein